MKKIMFATSLALALAPTTFAQDFCSVSTHSGESVTSTVLEKQGPIGDYHYETWANAGTNTSVYYTDGSFQCEFSGVSDILCREGLAFGMNSGKSYKDIGHLYADFNIPEFSLAQANGVSYGYIGVYGWSQNPLIEWYIVDNWGPWRPNWIGKDTKENRGCEDCYLRGTITVDDAEYEVYVDKVQRGSIEGSNTPFVQYFSVRKNKRNCGTIDITAHFQEWEKLGLNMGASMYEAKVVGEAGQYPEDNAASGSFNFTYAKVYVNGAVENVNGAEDSDDVLPPAALPVQNFKQGELESAVQVFDMQGRYLGSLNLNNGTTVNEALRNTFHSAGAYLVKQGNVTQHYVVK